MLKADNDSYDVIIIGAGISGLVCGCYLAKAGMKVLIVEQHYKPGGYCSSFKRQGFTFDAAAHSIGGFKYGNLGNIFEDLKLYEKVTIKKFDPSNIIMTSDYKITFWDDLSKTIKDFQINFPNEKYNINNFFNFLVTKDPKSSSSMKSWTFENLLDKYFNDNKLKAILSFPLFGNSGLPPSLISAFIGIKIFREFLLDGGYYPESCMQSIPDALVERFKEFRGELQLLCRAKKIIVKNNKVSGVVLEKSGFIPSKYVISNCDARQTFFNLLGKRIVSKDFLSRINNMIPSLSAFILYLGIDEYFKNLPETNINIWIMSHYDLDKMYLSAEKGNFNSIGGYLLHISPDRKCVLALMNTPFKNKYYWIKNKEKLSESLIKRIDADAFHGLSKHIRYKDAATPYTLYRYTSNYKGAAFGWACSLSQLALTDFRKPSFIQSLYLTGHWTTKGLGIPGVAYIGYDTAKMILKKEKLKL